jgi:hypothetical protein
VRGASRIRGCRCCTSVSAPASSSAPSGMAAVSGPGRGHVPIGRRHGARRCSVRRRGLLLRWARRTLLGLALEDSRRGQNAGLGSRSGAAAAPRTPVVVFLPPAAAAAAAAALPLLSRGSSILRGLPLPLPFLLLFFLSGALAPAAALGDASPAERRLKLPRRETKHGPRPSPRTVRARRRKRRSGSRRGRRSGRTGTGVHRGTRRSSRRCGLTGRRGRRFGWLLAAGATAPGLALAGRGWRWLGRGWSGGCVSGLRLRRGARLSGRLLRGCGCGCGPPRRSFA